MPDNPRNARARRARSAPAAPAARDGQGEDVEMEENRDAQGEEARQAENDEVPANEIWPPEADPYLSVQLKTFFNKNPKAYTFFKEIYDKNKKGSIEQLVGKLQKRDQRKCYEKCFRSFFMTIMKMEMVKLHEEWRMNGEKDLEDDSFAHNPVKLPIAATILCRFIRKNVEENTHQQLYPFVVQKTKVDLETLKEWFKEERKAAKKENVQKEKNKKKKRDYRLPDIAESSHSLREKRTEPKPFNRREIAQMNRLFEKKKPPIVWRSFAKILKRLGWKADEANLRAKEWLEEKKEREAEKRGKKKEEDEKKKGKQQDHQPGSSGPPGQVQNGDEVDQSEVEMVDADIGMAAPNQPLNGNDVPGTSGPVNQNSSGLKRRRLADEAAADLAGPNSKRMNGGQRDAATQTAQDAATQTVQEARPDAVVEDVQEAPAAPIAVDTEVVEGAQEALPADAAENVNEAPAVPIVPEALIPDEAQEALSLAQREPNAEAPPAPIVRNALVVEDALEVNGNEAPAAPIVTDAVVVAETLEEVLVAVADSIQELPAAPIVPEAFIPEEAQEALPADAADNVDEAPAAPVVPETLVVVAQEAQEALPVAEEEPIEEAPAAPIAAEAEDVEEAQEARPASVAEHVNEAPAAPIVTEADDVKEALEALLVAVTKLVEETPAAPIAIETLVGDHANPDAEGNVDTAGSEVVQPGGPGISGTGKTNGANLAELLDGNQDIEMDPMEPVELNARNDQGPLEVVVEQVVDPDEAGNTEREAIDVHNENDAEDMNQDPLENLVDHHDPPANFNHQSIPAKPTPKKKEVGSSAGSNQIEGGQGDVSQDAQTVQETSPTAVTKIIQEAPASPIVTETVVVEQAIPNAPEVDDVASPEVEEPEEPGLNRTGGAGGADLAERFEINQDIEIDAMEPMDVDASVDQNPSEAYPILEQVVDSDEAESDERETMGVQIQREDMDQDHFEDPIEPMDLDMRDDQSHPEVVVEQVVDPVEAGTFGRRAMEVQNEKEAEDMDQDYYENLRAHYIPPTKSERRMLRMFVEKHGDLLVSGFQPLYQLLNSVQAQKFFKDAVRCKNQFVLRIQTKHQNHLKFLPQINAAFKAASGFSLKALEEKRLGEDLEEKGELDVRFEEMFKTEFMRVLRLENSRNFYTCLVRTLDPRRPRKHRRILSTFFGFNMTIVQVLSRTPQHVLAGEEVVEDYLSGRGEVSNSDFIDDDVCNTCNRPNCLFVCLP